MATEPPDGVTRNNPYSTASGSRAVLAACHIAYGMAWSHLQGSKPSFDNAPSLIGSSTRACCQRGLYEAVALIPSVFPNGSPPLSRLIPSLPDTRSAARTSLELDLTGLFFHLGCAKASLWNWGQPQLSRLPKRLLFLSPSCTVCCTWGPANGLFCKLHAPPLTFLVSFLFFFHRLAINPVEGCTVGVHLRHAAPTPLIWKLTRP